MLAQMQALPHRLLIGIPPEIHAVLLTVQAAHLTTKRSRKSTSTPHSAEDPFERILTLRAAEGGRQKANM
jgi:hypothetical protein